MDVGKEWVSNEHQTTGKQVTSDPLEKNKTRNTSRPWWVALETLKELEDLKKLDSGVSRKRRNWATQQKAEIRRFYNKKFEVKHDVHRNLASSGDYLKPNKKGEYQYVSGVMGLAYNPFLGSEAGGAHRNYKVAELLKFWTEKIVEIDTVERET